jgi:class 3 adenylate cyclase
MSTLIPSEVQRVGLFRQFDTATESLYKRWLIKRTWPAIRVILWFSVVTWATAPVSLPRVLDVGGSFPPRVRLVCWAFALPLVLATALLRERQVRIWMQPVVLTLTTLSALLCIYWVEVPNTPIVMVPTTVLFLYLAPVLQFPFRSTGIVLLLTVPATVWWAISIAEREGTRNGTLNYQIWLLGSIAVIALIISLTIENNARARFVDERLIARQQEELATSRAMIRRYAPPAVADRLEHGDTTVDSPQRRRVTVFFADVVGFTTLADRIDPEALAEIMNEYLGTVAEILESRGGSLTDFAGDGVMAIFGAPDEMEPRDQVLAAVSAARALQAALPDMSRRWYTLGIDRDLQARVGINTGVVSVGTFGSAVRATYTGFGIQTNIAARIETQCLPGSILLSKTSYHLVSDTVTCQPFGEIDVKGVHFPIGMYEPQVG